MHIFHRWGKWETISGKQWWHWSDGTHSSTPQTFQCRECFKCGKRKIVKLHS